MSGYLEAAGIRLSDEEQLARIQHGFELIRIVTVSDQRVAMVKARHESDRTTLIQIQVLPQFQNRGIGRRMIGDLIDGARRRSVPVELSVLKVNPAGALYERLGFKIVGDTPLSHLMRHDPEAMHD